MRRVEGHLIWKFPVADVLRPPFGGQATATDGAPRPADRPADAGVAFQNKGQNERHCNEVSNFRLCNTTAKPQHRGNGDRRSSSAGVAPLIVAVVRAAPPWPARRRSSRPTPPPCLRCSPSSLPARSPFPPEPRPPITAAASGSPCPPVAANWPPLPAARPASPLPLCAVC